MVLAASIFLCFVDIDGSLKAVLIICIAILALPITLLIAIDASRVIEREMAPRRSVNVLGRILAFPQAVIGVVLIGASIVCPVIELPKIIADMTKGHPDVFTIVNVAIAGLMFVIGVRYVKEGLGLGRAGR